MAVVGYNHYRNLITYTLCLHIDNEQVTQAKARAVAANTAMCVRVARKEMGARRSKRVERLRAGEAVVKWYTEAAGRVVDKQVRSELTRNFINDMLSCVVSEADYIGIGEHYLEP
jgi:hypothetical protein